MGRKILYCWGDIYIFGILRSVSASSTAPSLFSPNLYAQTTLKVSWKLPKEVRPFSQEFRIHLALSSQGRWTC